MIAIKCIIYLNTTTFCLTPNRNLQQPFVVMITVLSSAKFTKGIASLFLHRSMAIKSMHILCMLQPMAFTNESSFLMLVNLVSTLPVILVLMMASPWYCFSSTTREVSALHPLSPFSGCTLISLSTPHGTSSSKGSPSLFAKDKCLVVLRDRVRR